jgi:hypothetical protein
MCGGGVFVIAGWEIWDPFWFTDTAVVGVGRRGRVNFLAPYMAFSDTNWAEVLGHPDMMSWRWESRFPDLILLIVKGWMTVFTEVFKVEWSLAKHFLSCLIGLLMTSGLERAGVCVCVCVRVAVGQT